MTVCKQGVWIVISISNPPSSRFVPAMNGNFANFPCANSLEGRSGMSPSGPSMTGWKIWTPVGNELSTCDHAVRTSSKEALFAQSMEVPAATVPVQSVRFAMNVSQTGCRREALKRAGEQAAPDSNICH